MIAARNALFKLLTPIIVLVGLLVGLAMLPQVFPDHGLVSDAIDAGDSVQVRALLDRGADPNSRRAIVSTLAKFLVRTGYASRTELDFGLQTPLLIEALNQQKFAIAELLLERGADPNAVDEFEQAALARAREMEAPPPLMELLLAKGAR